MSVKKTYWKGISEKHQTPEFVEANTKEFQDDLTIDEFVGGQDVEQFKTGRRDFLKFMGFSIAAATLASCAAVCAFCRAAFAASCTCCEVDG